MTFFAKLTRRGLLKMVAGTTIGVFFLSQHTWFSWKPGSVSHTGEEILWQHVQRILIHPESAMVIGRKYLQCRTCEANARELTRLIIPKKQLTSLEEGNMGLANFKSFIQGRIREDFLAERVVTLEGWILSLTEVRLCSLVAVKMDQSIAVG